MCSGSFKSFLGLIERYYSFQRSKVLTGIHAGLLRPIGYCSDFAYCVDFLITFAILGSGIQSNKFIFGFYTREYGSCRSRRIRYLLIYVVSLQIYEI